MSLEIMDYLVLENFLINKRKRIGIANFFKDLSHFDVI